MKLGPRRRPKNTKGARQTSVVADLFLRDAREAIELLPKACLAASKPWRRRNVLADRPLRAGCPNRHVENDPGARGPSRNALVSASIRELIPSRSTVRWHTLAEVIDHPSRSRRCSEMAKTRSPQLRLERRRQSLDVEGSTRPYDSRRGPIRHRDLGGALGRGRRSAANARGARGRHEFLRAPRTS